MKIFCSLASQRHRAELTIMCQSRTHVSPSLPPPLTALGAGTFAPPVFWSMWISVKHLTPLHPAQTMAWGQLGTHGHSPTPAVSPVKPGALCSTEAPVTRLWPSSSAFFSFRPTVPAVLNTALQRTDYTTLHNFIRIENWRRP